MTQGAFTFVLHSHLPYCRQAGRWPHGEEWLHEAISESYLPLLMALDDLHQEGCPFRLTVGITPVLAEQLADGVVLAHLEEFLEEKQHRAEADIGRFKQEGDDHRAYLAGYYRDWYVGLLAAFRERFSRDIVGAFRRLQDQGHIEILTSAATHGYLPLLSRDSSIHGQLAVGADVTRRHFGEATRGAWLPECAYRPPHMAEGEGGGYLKPGLEEFLAELGITCFFAETHTLEGGLPVGKARGEAIGPYGDIPRRYVVPLTGYSEPTEKTTFQPYWVQSPRVAVLGRNNATGMQVWSADWGYPGDFWYREFHKKDGVSGLQYWRITGAKTDLGSKAPYEPSWAEKRRQEHVAHYAGLVQGLLANYYQQNGKVGIIVASYDTELFGHWWFEGIAWIQGVLRELCRSEIVELTTASDFIARHPPEDVLALPEGSWGVGGGHFTWDNVDTSWMWPIIHDAERQMEELASQHPAAESGLAEVLAQAARELLLIQSSDWPFLVTTGQAREYAVLRFQEHLDRFQRLAGIARGGEVSEGDVGFCRELFERDKVFPHIDYRLFRPREGLAASQP
jgi:1,4-alpha-glucan branching enzyme